MALYRYRAVRGKATLELVCEVRPFLFLCPVPMSPTRACIPPQFSSVDWYNDNVETGKYTKREDWHFVLGVRSVRRDRDPSAPSPSTPLLTAAGRSQCFRRTLQRDGLQLCGSESHLWHPGALKHRPALPASARGLPGEGLDPPPPLPQLQPQDQGVYALTFPSDREMQVGDGPPGSLVRSRHPRGPCLHRSSARDAHTGGRHVGLPCSPSFAVREGARPVLGARPDQGTVDRSCLVCA